MSVYLSVHLGWPGRLEEAVPKHAKMAHGSSDRAPRARLPRMGRQACSSVSSSLPGAVCQPPPGYPLRWLPTGSQFPVPARADGGAPLPLVSRPHNTSDAQTRPAGFKTGPGGWSQADTPPLRRRKPLLKGGRRSQSPRTCGVPEVCLACELRRWPGSAVGHHDHPCPCACSTSSSSGSAAGWSCSAGHRPPRTPSCSCCGTRSPCCAAPIPAPGSTGPTAPSLPR